MPEAVVVIGTGGMGLASARRLGPSRRLVLADFAPDLVESAAATLRGDGHQVTTHLVDVTDAASVRKLADETAAEHTIRTVVHTAGISPSMASPERIIDVDLVGTAHVLDAFLPHAREGTALIAVASAGHDAVDFVTRQQEQRLATAPATELLAAGLEIARSAGTPTPMVAYALAKYGMVLRVQYASQAWTARGARVVTVSPGLVSTRMGRLEISGDVADSAQTVLDAASRLGTPDDIAAAVEWLAGPAASFISGTDLVVDGGAVAAQRWSEPTS